jgi:peptidoglycan/LPS O-acetylase OafA/YrhL
MEGRSRRRPRRKRWTPALLLALVAVTVLVLASPAVAKPAHVSHFPGATPTVAGTVALLAIAACGALALVLLAVLSGRRERSGKTTEVRAPKRATGTHQSAAA